MRPYTGIIGVRNGSAFIRNALQSMLQQSFPPKTIIVSDDGSSDGTPELVQAEFPNIKLLRNAPAGQGGALNKALAHTDTEYVAFLDHDDTWTLNKASLQISLLEADTDADAVFGGIQNIEVHMPSPLIHNMGPGRLLGASTFRRSCFERVGMFRTDTMKHTIIDWWSCAAHAGIKTLQHDEIVLNRHIHGDNFCITNKETSNAALIARIREHQMRQKAGA